MTSVADVHVHDALLADLGPATLYAILALRSRVFVLEQDCVYLDLDGRDLEPDARQLWVADGIDDADDAGDADVLATLRVLADPDDVLRIGRVATAERARGRGLAALLMQRALELAAGRDVVLDAQTYLRDWYARFGFVAEGEDFVEDGIPHVTMWLRRATHGQ